ncbi:unnamed protein product [Rodentolepis nana]|uniref:Uncharacterized protein n=1 Tax=Rodentolepis nana TaxID=102285 RepID=A0A3P7TFR9_RODNA|nr:unnamed protein product [Rodentolepis nana]
MGCVEGGFGTRKQLRCLAVVIVDVGRVRHRDHHVSGGLGSLLGASIQMSLNHQWETRTHQWQRTSGQNAARVMAHRVGTRCLQIVE